MFLDAYNLLEVIQKMFSTHNLSDEGSVILAPWQLPSPEAPHDKPARMWEKCIPANQVLNGLDSRAICKVN